MLTKRELVEIMDGKAYLNRVGNVYEYVGAEGELSGKLDDKLCFTSINDDYSIVVTRKNLLYGDYFIEHKSA